MAEFAHVDGHDFSPAMLRVMLQARAALRRELGEDEDVAALAGVSEAEFHHAWRGWLRKAGPRLRLWGALGLVPADHGVMLTDDGRQSARESAAIAQDFAAGQNQSARESAAIAQDFAAGKNGGQQHAGQ